jgi:hypothetical protein
MRTVFLTILGLLLGLVVGIAGPIGFSMFTAWMEDFKPGAGAPTAFAIMLPFTALAGAIGGAFLGYTRGATGAWTPGSPSATRTSLLTKLIEPSPLSEVIVQELAFKSSRNQNLAAEQEKVLNAAIAQYDEFKCSSFQLIYVALLTVLVPFTSILTIPLAVAYFGKRFYMRQKIRTAIELWSQQQVVD